MLKKDILDLINTFETETWKYVYNDKLDSDMQYIYSIEKEIQSVDEVVKLFLENVTEPENQEVYIIHGDDIEIANYVKDKLLKSGVQFKGINIMVVGAVIGVSTGPGMVGIFGMGKEVTTVGK